MIEAQDQTTPKSSTLRVERGGKTKNEAKRGKTKEIQQNGRNKSTNHPQNKKKTFFSLKHHQKNEK